MDNKNKTMHLSESEVEILSDENIGQEEPDAPPDNDGQSEHPTNPLPPQEPQDESPAELKAEAPTKPRGEVPPRPKGDVVSSSEMTVPMKREPTPHAKTTSKVDSPSPEIIDGRYEMVRCLGHGAMGAVYEVRHIRLDKRFAMKVIHPQLAKIKSTIARFHREASALSRLAHPNCVEITDFGQTEKGDFYLVMERVAGEILSDLIDNQGPLSVRESIEITRQVLAGLGHAHTAGIIHRDIKLENLIKTANEDGSFTVKILDFGLAKERVPDDGVNPITEAGIVLGTPQYIAPETITSQTMNQQTDIYAVGVTFFRMLIGQPLWDGEDIGEILQNKVRNPTPNINDIGCGEFSKSIENFLLKALAAPEKRFETVAKMQAALEKLDEELIRPKPRISILAETKIKPVTVAALRYSGLALASAFQHGKIIGTKFGSDVQAFLKNPPTPSNNPFLARVAALGKKIVNRIKNFTGTNAQDTPKSPPEDDAPEP